MAITLIFTENGGMILSTSKRHMDYFENGGSSEYVESCLERVADDFKSLIADETSISSWDGSTKGKYVPNNRDTVVGKKGFLALLKAKSIKESLDRGQTGSAFIEALLGIS